MTGLERLLAAALRAQGLTDDPATYDSDIHSWRCSHPDIYGPCSCFQEVVDDVATAVTAWLAERLASEEVREAVRRKVTGFVCNVSNLPEPLQVPALGLNMSPVIDGTADAALAAVMGALAGEGNADPAPEAAKTAPVSDRGPESGQGDHRDDEGRSGARDGGVKWYRDAAEGWAEYADPHVVLTGGPERIYDDRPKVEPPRPPIGFRNIETEPLRWDGDDA